MPSLAGVFAPLPTPFDEAGAVDLRRLRDAMPFWLRSPLTGFVVLGTNGESGLLTDEEADSVIGELRGVVPQGRPLIAGTGRESTRETVAACRRAAALGADAVIVRTPCFFKGQMTAAAFERYYLNVADASPVPVLLYNFTAATGVNLHPDVVGTLARHGNIIGIKESGGDIAQIADLTAIADSSFSVLAGSATTLFAALSVGAAGAILALAALVPDVCVQVFEFVQRGRLDEARRLQRRILPLARLISTGYGVPGLKAALGIRGIDVGLPRPPLAPAPEAAVVSLRNAIQTLEDVYA